MRPLNNDGIVHVLYPRGEVWPPIPIFAEVWRRYMLDGPTRFSLADIADMDFDFTTLFPVNQPHG